MTKLFVGGLPYSVTNQQLEEMFQKFGQVTSATIITDKFSGRSKGFGFVEMENDQEAQEAINQLNNTEIEGRRIGVSVARPKEESGERRSFDRGHGGFGGGNVYHSRGGDRRGGRDR